MVGCEHCEALSDSDVEPDARSLELLAWRRQGVQAGWCLHDFLGNLSHTGVSQESVGLCRSLGLSELECQLEYRFELSTLALSAAGGVRHGGIGVRILGETMRTRGPLGSKGMAESMAAGAASFVWEVWYQGPSVISSAVTVAHMGEYDMGTSTGRDAHGFEVFAVRSGMYDTIPQQLAAAGARLNFTTAPGCDHPDTVSYPILSASAPNQMPAALYRENWHHIVGVFHSPSRSFAVWNNGQFAPQQCGYSHFAAANPTLMEGADALLPPALRVICNTFDLSFVYWYWGNMCPALPSTMIGNWSSAVLRIGSDFDGNSNGQAGSPSTDMGVLGALSMSFSEAPLTLAAWIAAPASMPALAVERMPPVARGVSVTCQRSSSSSHLLGRVVCMARCDADGYVVALPRSMVCGPPPSWARSTGWIHEWIKSDVLCDQPSDQTWTSDVPTLLGPWSTIGDEVGVEVDVWHIPVMSTIAAGGWSGVLGWLAGVVHDEQPRNQSSLQEWARAAPWNDTRDVVTVQGTMSPSADGLVPTCAPVAGPMRLRWQAHSPMVVRFCLGGRLGPEDWDSRVASQDDNRVAVIANDLEEALLLAVGIASTDNATQVDVDASSLILATPGIVSAQSTSLSNDTQANWPLIETECEHPARSKFRRSFPSIPMFGCMCYAAVVRDSITSELMLTSTRFDPVSLVNVLEQHASATRLDQSAVWIASQIGTSMRVSPALALSTSVLNAVSAKSVYVTALLICLAPNNNYEAAGFTQAQADALNQFFAANSIPAELASLTECMPMSASDWLGWLLPFVVSSLVHAVMYWRWRDRIAYALHDDQLLNAASSYCSSLTMCVAVCPWVLCWTRRATWRVGVSRSKAPLVYMRSHPSLPETAARVASTVVDQASLDSDEFVPTRTMIGNEEAIDDNDDDDVPVEEHRAPDEHARHVRFADEAPMPAGVVPVKHRVVSADSRGPSSAAVQLLSSTSGIAYMIASTGAQSMVAMALWALNMKLGAFVIVSMQFLVAVSRLMLQTPQGAVQLVRLASLAGSLCCCKCCWCCGYGCDDLGSSSLDEEGDEVGARFGRHPRIAESVEDALDNEEGTSAQAKSLSRSSESRRGRTRCCCGIACGCCESLEQESRQLYDYLLWYSQTAITTVDFREAMTQAPHSSLIVMALSALDLRALHLLALPSSKSRGRLQIRPRLARPLVQWSTSIEAMLGWATELVTLGICIWAWLKLLPAACLSVPESDAWRWHECNDNPSWLCMTAKCATTSHALRMLTMPCTFGIIASTCMLMLRVREGISYWSSSS